MKTVVAGTAAIAACAITYRWVKHYNNRTTATIHPFNSVDVRCTAVGYQPLSERTLICTLRAGHDGDHNWVVSDEKATVPSGPDELNS